MEERNPPKQRCFGPMEDMTWPGLEMALWASARCPLSCQLCRGDSWFALEAGLSAQIYLGS